jgi:hypothetical protein
MAAPPSPAAGRSREPLGTGERFVVSLRLTADMPPTIDHSALAVHCSAVATQEKEPERVAFKLSEICAEGVFIGYPSLEAGD